MALSLFGGARNRPIPDAYEKLNLELNYTLETAIEALNANEGQYFIPLQKL